MRRQRSALPSYPAPLPLVSPCSSSIPSPSLARANPTIWAKTIPEPPWCQAVPLQDTSCAGVGVRMQNCCPIQVVGPIWMYSPVPHPAMGARAAPWAQHHQLLCMSPNPCLHNMTKEQGLLRNQRGAWHQQDSSGTFSVTVLETQATTMWGESE